LPCAQVGELVIGEAKTPQDVLIVLAEGRRCGSVVPAGTRCHRERPAWVTVRPGERVFDVLVVSPRVELRYVVHPVGCQHLLGRNMLCVKGVDDFCGRLGSRPIGDDRIDFVVRKQTPRRRRETRIAEQVR
jgi:hypothetical protein